MSGSAAEAPGGSPPAPGETGTSQELLQRLRELEAENSALAQANENQRETYERCLDEVANHVVQALLNQKDLREECIKLKKRVFELERQNQALSDLFQQKLAAGSLPQLPLHPLPLDPPASPPSLDCADPPPLPPGRCGPPTEVTPSVPSASPGLSPGAPPLDALSPFFKKKAQILEVLRKLEETDPLLGPPPASPGTPEPCAPPGWPPWGHRGGGGWRGAEGSPCSSPEEPAPPRGALLSALAERLLRGEGGGCCRRTAEAPGGPPRQHPAFLGLYTAGEETPEGGFSPGGGPDPLPSPPKVLKLPAPPGGLRLSPQLARASKIPCRGGNPEASLSRLASPDTPPDPPTEPPAFPPPRPYEAAEQPPAPPGPPGSAEGAAASPPSSYHGPGGSAPSRRPGKKPPEPGYLPFKERLVALGKLRGSEGRDPPSRPERVHGAEPRPPARVGGLGGSLKHPEPAHAGEPLTRCYSSGSMGDPGKPGGGKGRVTGGRTPPRGPPAPPAKTPHGSPTKLPTKGRSGMESVGSKVGPPRKVPSGGSEPPGMGVSPAGATAGHSAIEEKVMKGIEENVLRLQGQVPGTDAKGKAPGGGLASWFGLRRSKLPALSRRGDGGGGRGRDWVGGTPPTPLRREVKLTTRKLEAESLNISKLMEKAEDLRKALREEHAFLHGLAREKGRPRGTPRAAGPLPVIYQEVTAETFMQQLLDRVDGKDVPYESRLEHKRELGDLRRVPPDAKDPRLCRSPRNGLVGHLREPPDKVPAVGLRDELPSDESLPELGPSQHFSACGSLTRTLDSGIGTFPPPDYGGVPTKSTPKPRARPEALAGAVPPRPPPGTKVPRKARTLEREVPSAEELLVAGKHRSPPACHPPAPPGHRPPPQGGCHTAVARDPHPWWWLGSCNGGSAPWEGGGGHGGGVRRSVLTPPHPVVPADAGDNDEKPRRVQQSKNWTFPNAKACGAADPFLCPPGGLHQPVRAPACSPAGHRGTSPEAPPPLPPTLSASSSRTPSASDVGDEGSPEAQSRDGGHGPPGLEHSESLSDSLYDSLSSCGSQG
ncbi:LOW QUALITY PROTEIN: nck-associated protein 5-like [Pterocles gutturalis]